MRNSSQNIKYFYPIKPNNERTITDSCCYLIYMVLSLVVLSVLFFSFIKQQDAILLRPRDVDGHRCGQGQYASYPYVYFTELSESQQSLKKAVCISKCPQQQQQRWPSSISCLGNKLVGSCQQISNIYATESIGLNNIANNLLMMCQPQSNILNRIIKDKLYSGFGLLQVEQLYSARVVIAILCPLLCISIMLIQLFLLYCCHNLKGLFAANFVAFMAVSLFFALRLLNLQQEQKFLGSTIIAIIALTLLLLLAVYMLYNFQKFRRSLNYLNVCSSFILSNKRIIFLSLALFITWAISFSFALTIFIFILALGTQNETNVDYQFAYQTNSQWTTFATIIFILALIHYTWTCLIIQHIGKYVAIVGASNWIMHTPRHFKNALFTLFKYHLGSVMYGAAFITLFSWIAESFYFLVPNNNGGVCCCNFPKLSRFYQSRLFTRYIGSNNQMTYLMVGLNGQSYGQAGQTISPVLVQNSKVLGQTFKICNIIVKTCQFFVAFLTTLLCYQFLIITREGFNNVLTVFIIFMISLLLASFGLDPYNQAYQSMLLTVIINKSSNKKFKDQSGVAQFSSAKSIVEDNRISIYENIEKWLQQQVFSNGIQKSTHSQNSSINNPK